MPATGNKQKQQTTISTQRGTTKKKLPTITSSKHNSEDYNPKTKKEQKTQPQQKFLPANINQNNNKRAQEPTM